MRISESTNEADYMPPRPLAFTLAVIDTGVGISRADGASILEPFQQGEESAAKVGFRVRAGRWVTLFLHPAAAVRHGGGIPTCGER